jgi:hypothetical protein
MWLGAIDAVASASVIGKPHASRKVRTVKTLDVRCRHLARSLRPGKVSRFPPPSVERE